MIALKIIHKNNDDLEFWIELAVSYIFITSFNITIRSQTNLFQNLCTNSEDLDRINGFVHVHKLIQCQYTKSNMIALKIIHKNNDDLDGISRFVHIHNLIQYHNTKSN